MQQAPSGISISERQNSPPAIQLLSAQRQLYAEAKSLRRIRSWTAAALATAAVTATWLAPELLRIAAPAGALLAALSLVLAFIERRRVDDAANVQEQFDTTVLDLPWNHYRGEPRPVELVAAAAARFRGMRADLHNWYFVPSTANGAAATLLAQRANLVWDSDLRRAYALLTLGVLGSTLLLIVLAAALADLTVGVTMLALLTATPAVVHSTDSIVSHWLHSSRQVDLRRRTDSAFDRLRSRQQVHQSELRTIQDIIWDQRRTAPPVSDWYYARHKKRLEAEMRAGITELARGLGLS